MNLDRKDIEVICEIGMVIVFFYGLWKIIKNINENNES